jgi:hypothetical protein
MSQPEIFRRCSSCGASFRPGELFCAQCGNPTAIGRTGQGDASGKEAIVAAAADTAAVDPAPEPGAEESQQHHAGSVHTDSQTVTAPDISTPSDIVARPGHEPRVKTAQPQLRARGALENRMRPGVDKLRRVSNVVLDEAAYDSNLRFILVVGVLFVLFLVLLLLSKWIG